MLTNAIKIYFPIDYSFYLPTSDICLLTSLSNFDIQVFNLFA